MNCNIDSIILVLKDYLTAFWVCQSELLVTIHSLWYSKISCLTPSCIISWFYTTISPGSPCTMLDLSLLSCVISFHLDWSSVSEELTSLARMCWHIHLMDLVKCSSPCEFLLFPCDFTFLLYLLILDSCAHTQTQ